LAKGSKAPKVTKPGQLFSIDVWTCEVPYRWGGQQKVLLIHDHFSTRDFPFLLNSEAECAAKLKEFFAQCRVDDVSPVHVHGDNAKVFAEKGVLVETCRRVCNEMKPPVHFTTSCEYVPRQNGVCERRWGIHRADCCRQMAHAGANASLWWDCFRHSTDIEAMLPIEGHPDECGYSRWHKGLKKPRFAALARPWGCLCYAKYPVTGGGKRVDNKSKVAPQAARCMLVHAPRPQRGQARMEVLRSLHGARLRHAQRGFCRDVLPGHHGGQRRRRADRAAVCARL